MLRQIILSVSAMALVVSVASGAQAGPLDAVAIGATASTPVQPPTAGPTAAQPLTLTSPLNGITSAPTPQVVQPAQPAAVAPAK